MKEIQGKELNDSLNEIQDILNNMNGNLIQLREEVINNIFSSSHKQDYKFCIKKVLFGSLDSNNEVNQLMLAGEFNQLFVLSSINKIEITENNDEISFYSVQNEQSTIRYTIIKEKESGE